MAKRKKIKPRKSKRKTLSRSQQKIARLERENKGLKEAYRDALRGGRTPTQLRRSGTPDRPQFIAFGAVLPAGDRTEPEFIPTYKFPDLISTVPKELKRTGELFGPLRALVGEQTEDQYGENDTRQVKLRDRLNMLARTVPKRSKTLQLYRNKSDLKARGKRITLYSLFKSSEKTRMIRAHIFDKPSRALTSAEWFEWFERRNDDDEKNLEAVFRNGVLPGIEIRTSKLWSVERIIGWVFGKKQGTLNVKRKPRNSKVARRRHKTKRQRKPRG